MEVWVNFHWMKWKVYNVCCLYNIVAMIVFLILFIKEISREFSGINRSNIGELVFIMLFLSLMFVKTMMGRKLYARLKNHDVHEPGFGAFFYFLWILNIVCVVMLLVFAIDTIPSRLFLSFSLEALVDLVAFVSFYLYVLSSIYCLAFDISIEKKVRHQYDLSGELLKDENV